MAEALPWRGGEGCVIVRVRLTPKSSLDAVGAIVPTAEGPAISMRVRAVPKDGAANAAAVRVIAGWLELPGSRVRLSGGAKSRVKSLTIDGDPQFIEASLAGRLKAQQA